MATGGKLTQRQSEALLGMREKGALWRWPGGQWAWWGWSPGREIPRDSVGGRTVLALVNRQLAMPVRQGYRGRPYIVDLTQPGKDLADAILRCGRAQHGPPAVCTCGVC